MLIDSLKKLLVLRIAYAGAPLSGKTATVKSLMSILRSQGGGNLVYSPLEARGRTIYFDWAEYQGGSFRDGQVKCQITSVTGQESLRRRRNLLIEAADAVVFVIDSRPDQMEVNRRSLGELRPWLSRDGLAPIDVIYQCNKRDLPGTLGVDEIRRELDLGPEAELYESSAVQGDGVRIAFVAAVRFGVRQAELLRAAGRLPSGTPEIETGEQLLDRVRLADDPNAATGETAAETEEEPEPETVSPTAATQEASSPERAAEPARPAPLPAPPTSAAIPVRPARWSGEKPRPAVMPMADWLASQQEANATPPEPPHEPTALPSPWLVGGERGLVEGWPKWIWDAIRLTIDPHLDPPKGAAGALQGRIGGGWHARSNGADKSLEEGRAHYQTLVDWLIRLGDAVSSQRCVILSVGEDGWRVWQLVRELPTLGMFFHQGLEPGLPSKRAVQILTRISSEMVSTHRDFAARNVELPLLLRTLAPENGRTVYSGFLPQAPIPLRDGDALAHLESELRPLAKAHHLSTLNIPEALIELEQVSRRSPSVLPIVELLQSLLIGE